MNLCKLSSLDDLPKLPSLYKLHLNDNNLTDISEIVQKCPGLLELSLSGNKKIATIDQLKPCVEFKTLMRLDIEGSAFAEKKDYRKELFELCSTLACVDGLDSRGAEVPGNF
jgi:Leucine-rich repeat (LRR) protein